jgi:hypothetical protein
VAIPNEELLIGDISLVVDDPLRDAEVTIPRHVDWDRANGYLRWQVASDGMQKPSARGLIHRFVDLHGKEDAAIYHFARRYGVLGLTKGGDVEGSSFPYPAITPEGLLDNMGDEFRERIAYWRPYIASLKYLVACLTQLRVDPTVAPTAILKKDFPNTEAELWESFGLDSMDYTSTMRSLFDANGPHNTCRNLERVGPGGVLQHLASVISSHWIPQGGIHVILASDGHTMRSALRLGGRRPGSNSIMPENSLWHMLIGQLMAIATKPAPKEVVACTQCGRFYEPLRRPSRGQQHYCASCKSEVAKAKKREWAAKNRNRSIRKCSQTV